MHWRLEVELLCNSSGLIHHDAVINDPEDEFVMVNDDHGRRPKEIEFTLQQIFYGDDIFMTRLRGESRLELIKTYS